MSSEPIRDPVKDHLLTPQNSAFKTPTTFAMVHLDAGATAHFSVDDAAELEVYVLDGVPF